MKPLDVLVAIAAIAMLAFVVKAWPMIGDVQVLLDDAEKLQQ